MCCLWDRNSENSAPSKEEARREPYTEDSHGRLQERFNVRACTGLGFIYIYI